MKLLLVLPLLIPMTTAAVSILAWRRVQLQRWLGVSGAVGLLAAGVLLLDVVARQGIQVANIGNWPAPFGITMVADLFSAVMVVVAGVSGVAVSVYSLGTIDLRRQAFGYFPLLNILLMGVCGAFLTGDIFNLYVWFEIMLISSFVLLVLGGERRQMEGGLKYVALNLLSSFIFLIAVGILYGATGTLNMADLVGKLGRVEFPGMVTTLAILFLLAFGIKAALFPLFFWLPASYHTPPVAVSAIFAGLLTKVGVYALIRVFTLLFTQEVAYTHRLLLVLAGLTMVTGVLGAVSQREVRRILSFLVISTIGFMVMGLGLFTPLALAGSVFYIMHDSVVKTGLFLVSGVIRRLRGSEELSHVGGLYPSHPWLAVAFLFPALSLAGLPPFSGFVAKLALIQAGLAVGQYTIAATALVVSLLTLLCVSRIWSEAFWKPWSGETKALPLPKRREMGLMLGPLLALALITLVMGLTAEVFVRLAMQTAMQLTNPTLYVQAVLGGTP